MDTWIFQGGHPIVSVSAPAGGTVLHLAQERFRYLAGDGDAARWAVPLQLRYQLESGEVVRTTALLDGEQLEIDLPEPVVWVQANAEGAGFYRVRLSSELRDAMAALVAPGAEHRLSDIERYSLVDDTWASVLAGSTDPDAFVALAERFAEETDVAVWRRVLGGLAELERVLPAGRRPDLQARTRALVGPALERMGWAPRDGDSDRDRELRAALIGGLAVLGEDPAAQATARELFDRYRTDRTAVEANVAGAVVRATAAFAGAAEVDAIVEGFKTAETPQEEQRFLSALSDVRDPAQFERVLDLALSTEVRTQNAPYLLGVCIANRDNGARAWERVEAAWDDVNERFPSNSIVRMLNGIRSITDPALAARVEAFLADHPVPQAKQTLEQHLERMRVTVALAERVAAG
jgi:puromycin-sensitive aminopeptidase